MHNEIPKNAERPEAPRPPPFIGMKTLGDWKKKLMMFPPKPQEPKSESFYEKGR